MTHAKIGEETVESILCNKLLQHAFTHKMIREHSLKVMIGVQELPAEISGARQLQQSNDQETRPWRNETTGVAMDGQAKSSFFPVLQLASFKN